MFLGEHVLYGSSRLGTSTYDRYHMGYSDKSLAYPSVQEIYVCYAEADDTNLPFEPMGGTPTGPIGGNWETVKPYGPHKVPQFHIPITGVNLPWTPGVVTADPKPVTPSKEPTTFVPGRKRYEFSNHLGNVLVTVSDKPIGVDGNSDGIAEYYMLDVKTTSDYEPFGAPLYGRTLGEQVCSTYTDTGTVQLGVITETFDSSYTLAAVQAYDKWYRRAATTASVAAGVLRFKRVNTNAVSVGRGFTAVAGKPYSHDIPLILIDDQASQAGTFSSSDPASSTTKPCASCIFIHELVDHFVNEFIPNGKLYDSSNPDPRSQQDQTEYHSKALKNKGSVGRDGKDH